MDTVNMIPSLVAWVFIILRNTIAATLDLALPPNIRFGYPCNNSSARLFVGFQVLPFLMRGVWIPLDDFELTAWLCATKPIFVLEGHLPLEDHDALG
jgi:hypothetical protein